jgi:hypothetical protein
MEVSGPGSELSALIVAGRKTCKETFKERCIRRLGMTMTGCVYGVE